MKRQRLAKSGEGEDGFDELDVIVLDLIGKSSSNKAGETRGVIPASSLVLVRIILVTYP